MDYIAQRFLNADCFNICVIVCTLIPSAIVLVLVVPKVRSLIPVLRLENQM